MKGRENSMNYYAILVILLMGLITFGLRAVPFLVFHGDKELPKLVKDLGDILPASVMAVLIIYCLKDVPSDFAGSGLWQLVGVAVVAISYKWKHNTLLSLVLGTVCYMVLIRLPLF